MTCYFLRIPNAIALPSNLAVYCWIDNFPNFVRAAATDSYWIIIAIAHFVNNKILYYHSRVEYKRQAVMAYCSRQGTRGCFGDYIKKGIWPNLLHKFSHYRGGARLGSQTWHYIHGGPKKRSSLRVDNFATVRVGRRVICQVYKFCLEKVQN